MKSPAEKNIAILTAHGGVGDFLFQLDLAKRLELSGIPTLFLIRKNYFFLSQIAAASNALETKLMRADGFRYGVAIARVWILSLSKKVLIVNSFHFTHLRLPTKIFYRVALLLRARVIISKREKETGIPYEQLAYIDKELIWQRNNRIASYLTGKPRTEGFPILEFGKGASPIAGEYIHIHPVASSLSKSYPVTKLLEVLQILERGGHRIILTLTPDAEAWYVTPELHAYIASHPAVTFISKYFSFEEIRAYISGSRVFCTVNTGLLWLALMLGKDVVVCDIETAYEWNPAPYGAVRLAEPEGTQTAEAIIETYRAC